MTEARIEKMIWKLLDARQPTASICPSDVARALATEDAAWRALMPQVRHVAALLAADGLLTVTRGKAVVDARSAGGPIRLRRAGAADADA